ncbi:hypothetical protein GE061_014641 [Apolygus lucorum]|uniref:Sulfatase N-terminal domain-containing protein n=1 Tax=Apolygus lucorum TaxID=248454 RepID=A0A8S9XJX8_APOLU|nr:hypothetical protein GE061_014641 [Apolygus lucorum]
MWTISFVAVLLINFAERLEATGGKSYSVYSPSCHMLDPDPFDESIAKFVEKREPTSCASKPPLTSVSEVSRSHTLHLHRENFHHYSPEGDSIWCVYDLIRRYKDNAKEPNFIMDTNYLNSSTYGISYPLERDVTFIDDTEFVKVDCFQSEYGKIKLIYVNMHAFIGFKEEVGRKISFNIENQSKIGKMGVMIIGFDSMSRSSLRRNMPNTVQLLKMMGWYSLEGYNKIEDNTFPNLIAILSGKSIQQLIDTCWPSQYVFLDQCPFIWKNFSNKDYITAYAEDNSGVSTFNCLKRGFSESPTDYYLRPFVLAADELVRNGSCVGPIKAAHHIFNYSIDFARCFQNQPTFSLFWLNSFSHNDANEPSTMDDEVVSYFKRLADSGIFKTTMVIFLSDHGLRTGLIRETYVGHVEDRQPFIYLWVPESFKIDNPEKISSLERNTYKLTSPYDVHLTLVDVLGENSTAEGCPGCQSLFEPVPWNRSCLDAGITEHWCACNEYEDVLVDFRTQWVQDLAKAVVDQINYHIIGSIKVCVKLNLKSDTFGETENIRAVPK